MKATPGPWTVGNEQNYQVDRYEKNAEWARIRDLNGGLIAKVESVNPKGQRKSCDFDIEAANARLIATAPELLDLLKAAIARVELANEEGDNILAAWLPDAKAIVTKIERGEL